MPPRASSTLGMQQSKLSFVSSKSSAAASKGGKAAVLGKNTKTLAIKPEAKDDIDIFKSSEEERSLDDIEPPSSEDEKQEATRAEGKPSDRPTVEKRDLPKTSVTERATRSSTGTRKVSGTTSASAAVAEKVAKIKEEPEVDIMSHPKLDVKDAAYTELSNKASQQMGFIAPIHGEDQNRVHKILRVFDLSYEYGPAVGMTRLERWERAKALGLNPPKEIYDILNTQEGLTKPGYAKNVFAGQV
ncbi:DNA polymerase delta, subunit 4-domain-containing protein [Coprinopsis sp. MPI-PUGE-AT-0042]|nr:DNA polymerase delta, subunit 4-domain-containing protein [Coprinopsis sp. MPI-PUGE-AT-0042]